MIDKSDMNDARIESKDCEAAEMESRVKNLQTAINRTDDGGSLSSEMLKDRKIEALNKYIETLQEQIATQKIMIRQLRAELKVWHDVQSANCRVHVKPDGDDV